MPETLTPPHDLLAEQSALGGMLLTAAVVDDVFDECAPGDFYVPKHEYIANAIRALVARSEPCDVIAVADYLAKASELRQAGGAEYLHELTSLTVTSSNAGYYATVIHSHAVRRRLLEAGMRIVQMGQSTEGDLDTLVDSARRQVDDVVGLRQVSVELFSETIGATIASIGEPVRQIESPWWKLNEAIGGFREGALYVVGARPGIGKSNTALQMTAELARYGAVAFCSLEMSRRELELRLIAQGAGVPLSALEGARPMSEFLSARVAAWRLNAPLNVGFETSGGMSVFDVRAFARTLHRRHKLSAVVVDYIQLMTDSRDVSRQEKVSDMTRGLKLLAKEMQVPVIALSQLNRGPEQRAEKMPQLSDLRESGAIEQDADVVILLHRDTTPSDEVDDDLQMFVAKNRHGHTGIVHTRWEGEFVRAVDMTERRYAA